MVAVVHGMGYHHEELSLEERRTALFVRPFLLQLLIFILLTLPQYCYLYEIFYVLVGVALKVAIGIFFLRIAIERWQLLLIKCIIFGCAGFGIVCLFLVVFQCIPSTITNPSTYMIRRFVRGPILIKTTVNTFWLVYPANNRCIPIPASNGITFALNAMNACTDWILGTLPFFMVRHLNMSFRTKMLVVAILAFAAVFVFPFH